MSGERLMGTVQEGTIIPDSTKEFFLESFRRAWQEHIGPRHPGDVAEYERRASVAGEVKVWQNVLTHLGMAEEMGIAKLEVIGIKPDATREIMRITGLPL